MAARTRVRKRTGTAAGVLRSNARRSGEANGEDQHVQTKVGDRWLFCLQKDHTCFILSENRKGKHPLWDEAFSRR